MLIQDVIRVINKISPVNPTDRLAIFYYAKCADSELDRFKSAIIDCWKEAVLNSKALYLPVQGPTHGLLSQTLVAESVKDPELEEAQAFGINVVFFSNVLRQCYLLGHKVWINEYLDRTSMFDSAKAATPNMLRQFNIKLI